VLGWDSHNSVVMAIDSAGQIHLAGNMHDNGLTYYRTREPAAIATFEQVAAMTGRDEDRCTYPLFMTLADSRLVFRYRSGQSGNGDWIMNVFDTATQTWRRHIDTPLFDTSLVSSRDVGGLRCSPPGITATSFPALARWSDMRSTSTRCGPRAPVNCGSDSAM
jgi:hypothetical protein